MKYNHGAVRFEFSDECLTTLASHRQISRRGREIGGQLFARVDGDVFKIEVATVTKGNSKRARFRFWPDRRAEKADIERLFDQGLHYVGDWHTHPEPNPSPSSTDEAEMVSIFQRSTHELDAMVLVIVGQSSFPQGLYVGAVTDGDVVLLHPDAAQTSHFD